MKTASLAHLAWEARTLGLDALPVEMTPEELETSQLPVLAHLTGNHFVAVVGLAEGRATLVDSLRGQHEMAFNDLAEKCTGKYLSFDILGSLASTGRRGCAQHGRRLLRHGAGP